MRYDTPSLFLFRNPYGDESLADIVRGAFVCDSSQRAAALAKCIEMPELRRDLLSPDDDLSAHFRKYRPDILIISTLLLGGDNFAKLLWGLRDAPCPMPYIVTLGKEPDEADHYLVEGFRSWLHLGAWCDPFTAAEEVRRFISREMLNREFLSRKLRASAAVTLKAMHAVEGTGFDYLLDEVTEVLENSFVFFDSAHTLHKAVTAQRGVSPAAVEKAVTPVIQSAVKSMTDSEYSFCFAVYTGRNHPPGELEFVYAAARMTFLTCQRIMQHLDSLDSHK